MISGAISPHFFLCRHFHFPIPRNSATPILLAALSLMLAASAHPQSQAGAKPDTKAGTSEGKRPSPGPKLILEDGVWFGNASFEVENQDNESLRTVLFAIDKHRLAGHGVIPVSFACKERRVTSVPGTGPMLVQSASYRSSSVQDLSEIVHFSGPNSFRATFSEASQTAKYIVVVKGTFLSESSASGSISVTSSACKSATVYTWEAKQSAKFEQPKPKGAD
ncbi:MAG: hypothetical protein ACLPLR_05710 [Terriglobales bacterium]